MDNKLAEALVLKGVLPVGTEVKARHKVMGLGSVNNVSVVDNFSITGSVIREDGRVQFKLADLRCGNPSSAYAEDVQEIDGMDPVRFASVYNITAAGDKAVLGKRRGRKPKNRVVED